jgi:Fe-S cluster biogenesis protein NfuA
MQLTLALDVQKISEMSNEEIQVLQILDSLRPAMEADGGGVELISVQDGVVKIKFKGACLVCPSINMTLKLGIEKALKEKFTWIKIVNKETV